MMIGCYEHICTETGTRGGVHAAEGRGRGTSDMTSHTLDSRASRSPPAPN